GPPPVAPLGCARSAQPGAERDFRSARGVLAGGQGGRGGVTRGPHRHHGGAAGGEGRRNEPVQGSHRGVAAAQCPVPSVQRQAPDWALGTRNWALSLRNAGFAKSTCTSRIRLSAK